MFLNGFVLFLYCCCAKNAESFSDEAWIVRADSAAESPAAYGPGYDGSGYAAVPGATGLGLGEGHVAEVPRNMPRNDRHILEQIIPPTDGLPAAKGLRNIPINLQLHRNVPADGGA